MKLKILVTGLLLGILVGCGSQDESSETQQPEQQAPMDTEIVETQPQETEPKLAKTSFPKESCGDSFPDDSSADSINFFPVFVDYSERNLKLVKAKFCEDAFIKNNEKSGKDEIQVASFTSQKRADLFANLMNNELGSGHLGYPTLRSKKLQDKNFHSNPFDSVSFPQQSCGDSLPKDKNAYPVEFYIVFTSYTIDKVKLIQEKYCQQVFYSISETSGDVIQIASLIGRERAEEFKKFLSRDFKDIQISNSTTIADSLQESAIVDTSSEINRTLNSSPKISAAALLNESQLNTLLEIDRTQAYLYSKKSLLKVVLPTYIPKGFELAELEINKKDEGIYGGFEYSLLYKNANNSCFTFSGGAKPPMSGLPSFAITIDVPSPALGRVTMTAVNSDKSSNEVNFVGFADGVKRDFGEFSFYSPYRDEKESCQIMSFVEALKVAESLQFLQPDLTN